jgi:hypothetical protein
MSGIECLKCTKATSMTNLISKLREGAAHYWRLAHIDRRAWRVHMEAAFTLLAWAAELDKLERAKRRRRH